MSDWTLAWGYSLDGASNASEVVLRPDLNCSRLMFLSWRWDGNMFQREHPMAWLRPGSHPVPTLLQD